ncbi:MAG: Crp/Fnr family transcriptional regulator [Firmicutes bacterium]|nr:Crp/Fnr family transcriptional regulator [Bacillota bacterium]
MCRELKKLSLFSDVDLGLIKNLVSAKQIIKTSYIKGKTVHEQHAECLGLDVVVSGNLVAYSLAQNGSETIIFEFDKDNIIGGSLLFGEQNKYPMNIYCTADCVLFYISKSAVKQLLREYSFVIQFIKSLSLNSQGMNKKVLYTQKTLRENLIDYFTMLSAEQKSKFIVLPVTKKQLADRFGVQRPSLFRELQRMKAENLIEVDNRRITLFT